jgi:GT2 family glycosyltransferase
MEAHRTGLNRVRELPAAVVIGRNEGARLLRCLDSLAGHADPIIYVDSGSGDGSVAAARARAAAVVELDLDRPFTAARARNAGLAYLRAQAELPDWVQFVDGDCEVREGWWKAAVEFLEQHPEVAVVCGRRRERHPEASIYNHLCDLEWDTPVGEARACGGDALMRITALTQVGDYREDLIAGEEPELCVRLRAKAWKIHRLDVEMTLHDAAITRFSQWWRRMQRSGHAFAEGAALHGDPPERHCVRETRRALAWGFALPAMALALAAISHGWGLIVLLAYPAQVVRLMLIGRRELRSRIVQAVFHVLGRFAEALGVLTYWWRRCRSAAPRLIEYK